MLIYELYRRLPPEVRARAKRVLGATGHAASQLDRLKATKDAQGKKRLDRSLEHLVDTLGMDACRNISGSVCVDFGAGYVPTDGLAMWLLGAAEVYAIDYNAIWSPAAVRLAIRAADRRVVERTLERVGVPDCALQRLDPLWEAGVDEAAAGPLPLNYIAPLDIIDQPERVPRYDLLWSTSVLEHIPPSRLPALLRAVTSRQREGGRQAHFVDLRDHLDFDRAPYRFLDSTIPFDADALADERGNGLTAEAWSTLLAQLDDVPLTLTRAVGGRPELVPAMPRGLASRTSVADFAIVSTDSRLACEDPTARDGFADAQG